VTFVRRLLILEAAVVLLSGFVWLFAVPKPFESFRDCVFVVGAVFVGLGTVFHMESATAVLEHLNRRTWSGTSMSEEESLTRAFRDRETSYGHSIAFAAAGLIAIAMVFLLPT
jgi:hypothetical protein